MRGEGAVASPVARRLGSRAARCAGFALVAMGLVAAGCGHELEGLDADALDRGAIHRFDKYYSAIAQDGKLWVVGYAGKIIHASRPEGPWQVQRDWHERSLFDIDTVDGERLWAVGELGLLLHSSDGGATWEPQQSGIEQENLLSVDFVDARTGFVVGEYGVMLRTRDGGRTWEQLPVSSDAILSDVQFFDAKTGIVAGEFGTFITTQDGGESWHAPTGRFAEAETYLYGLDFETPMRGLVTGLEGRVYETRDGGATWHEYALPTDSPIFDVRLLPRRGDAAIAFGDKGLLFQRNGKSWELVETHVFTHLRSSAFVDDSRGIVVGGKGTILLTEDQGRTWKRISDAPELEG